MSADVISFTGAIHEGYSPKVLGVIEALSKTKEKKDTLYIILTTTGGSAHAVDVYVNIIRHHYKTVNSLFLNTLIVLGQFFA